MSPRRDQQMTVVVGIAVEQRDRKWAAADDVIFLIGFGAFIGHRAAEKAILIGAGFPIQLALWLLRRRGLLCAGNVADSPRRPKLLVLQLRAC